MEYKVNMENPSVNGEKRIRQLIDAAQDIILLAEKTRAMNKRRTAILTAGGIGADDPQFSRLSNYAPAQGFLRDEQILIQKLYEAGWSPSVVDWDQRVYDPVASLAAIWNPSRQEPLADSKGNRFDDNNGRYGSIFYSSSRNPNDPGNYPRKATRPDDRRGDRPPRGGDGDGRWNPEWGPEPTGGGWNPLWGPEPTNNFIRAKYGLGRVKGGGPSDRPSNEGMENNNSVGNPFSTGRFHTSQHSSRVAGDGTSNYQTDTPPASGTGDEALVSTYNPNAHPFSQPASGNQSTSSQNPQGDTKQTMQNVFSQIRSQRSGYNGNRRFHPFGGKS